MTARFVRQVLVAEIGVTGQAAIEAATVELAADGLTADIFAAYATRAGFATVRIQASPSDARPAAATEVREGARAAVRAIVATLEAARRTP